MGNPKPARALLPLAVTRKKPDRSVHPYLCDKLGESTSGVEEVGHRLPEVGRHRSHREIDL